MCRNVRDSYKLYKQSSVAPVDLKTYISYANEYNKFLANKVLEGETITLPSRMGLLSIIGKKQKIRFADDGTIKGLAPDWVKTKQLWIDNPEAKENKKVLYHTNSHTDNVRYKFFWSKINIITLNKVLYSLKMTRDNKRAVHNLIKEGKQYVTKYN